MNWANLALKNEGQCEGCQTVIPPKAFRTSNHPLFRPCLVEVESGKGKKRTKRYSRKLDSLNLRKLKVSNEKFVNYMIGVTKKDIKIII